MNCERFDAWLDEGCPGAEAPAARAHARECARCADALEATLELDAAFGSALAAPDGFTDRVMARVAAAPQFTPPAPAAPRGAFDLSLLPWWVRAAMEPAVVLACAVAALFVACGDRLLQGANLLAARAGAALAATSAPPALVALEDPRVMLALTLAIAPGVVWASTRLYRWGRSIAR